MSLWTSAAICRQKINASATGVRAGLAAIRAILHRHRLKEDDLGSVELVLAEVLNNIVEHAYAQRHDGVIEIFISPCEAGLAVRVFDTGAPMPDLTLPPGQPANIDVALPELPEGSFGWNLIRTVADDIQYVRVTTQNRLSFRIPLTQAPPPSETQTEQPS
ncbi:ATP-binding protein [Pseudoruegeria sp. SK021]|uniref:ATP-binding protein n=1 Tax=Pseudoruegeria sp. SK021 TaxID=1933035 RepID=UPI000A242F1C|nr:ATP-binding protein [Pseudoruegeria sp. SK021]OSP55049.1 hypothetical protein BV911_09480 [Pseudoruegeria sp. SK021]